jgi:dolichol-phosphate mannosyltransferase
MTATLYILMPVLNEKPNINRLLKDLNTFQIGIAEEFTCCVVAVDDGSTDGTVMEIETNDAGLDITILRHKQNLGPGAAFATAFTHLRHLMKPGDWVVTMEADNTSSLRTLQQMLVRRKEGYECVLASPYAYGGGFVQTSFFRIVLSHIGNIMVKILFKLRGINTFSSFFRLYSSDLMNKLYHRFGPTIVESTGFESMVELLYKIVLVEATISEVEMKVDWSQREGKSKMRIINTALGYLRVFFNRNLWKNSASGCNLP